MKKRRKTGANHRKLSIRSHPHPRHQWIGIATDPLNNGFQHAVHQPEWGTPGMVAMSQLPTQAPRRRRPRTLADISTERASSAQHPRRLHFPKLRSPWHALPHQESPHSQMDVRGNSFVQCAEYQQPPRSHRDCQCRRRKAVRRNIRNTPVVQNDPNWHEPPFLPLHLLQSSSTLKLKNASRTRLSHPCRQ